MGDFSHWDFLDTFGNIEAGALIAGIDPTAVGDGDNWRRTYPIHQRLAEGFSLAIANYPRAQPPEALLCTSMQSAALPKNISSDIALEKFHREELARWLIAVKISPAYQFRKLSDVATQMTEKAAAPAGRWPWGNHHTDSLGHLEAAARRWWVNYDPDDTTTMPTNKAVSEWLQKERGATENIANSIASILRLDGLPTGPRK